MKNAYKFREVFGLYATELWVMPEKDFLEWLNAEADTPQTETQTETQNSNDDFPSTIEDWEDEYTEHDRVDCSWK